MTLDEYSSRQPKSLTLIQGLVLGFYVLTFPALAIADSTSVYVPDNNISIIDEPLDDNEIVVNESKENSKILVSEADSIAQKPVASKQKTVSFGGKRVITAYNSEAAQCDASPCITANGFNVCEHGIEDTIAANWLKFGTKVRIPELFGDRIFIVRDRMNARHADKVDVWFKEKSDAIKFGVRIARIEVAE